MPIDFRCSQCGKLLRTGDDTAGRQAQCPECGTISVVPSSTAPSEAPVPPLAPLGGGNPFAAGQATPEQPGSGNPYQAPRSLTFSAMGQADPLAEQRLAGPATALTVTGILGLVGYLGIAVLYGLGGFVWQNHGMGRAHNPEELMLVVCTMETMAFVGLVTSILVLVGAQKMKNRRSYGWAMAASIIAVCPCIGPCFLLGLPFGIWSLVVLCDESVKAAFQG